MYSGVVVITESSEVKPARQRNVKEPWWKRRLEGQIKDLRRDLSRLKQFKRGMFSEEEGSNGEFPAQTLLAREGFRGGSRRTETENNSKGQQGEKLLWESHTVKQNRLSVNNRHQPDGDVQEEQEAICPPA